MGYSSYQGLAGGGGGSGLDPMGDTVSQPGNTFGGLEWVRHDGTQWLLAQANTETNAEAIGIVTEIIAPGDSFKVKQIGQIQSLSALNPACPYLPLVPGRAYFLSETDGGQITLAEPKDTGTVSKPCLFSTGVDSCFIYSYRGLINDTYQNNGGTIPPGGGSNTETFTQPGASIDFAPGDLVTTYDNGGVGEFRLADNRDFNQSQVVGMVSATNVDGNPDKFNVQSGGYADFLGGLNRGTLYYLGEDGKMTDTRPSAPNVFVRPVFMSKDDEDGYILDQQSINNAMSSESSGATFVNQPNAFWTGAVVRNDIGNNSFVLAQADSIQNATTSGIVTWTNGNAFIVQQSGWANLTHYSNQPGDVILPGQKYWLSATNAGYMTPIEPTAPGLVSKLMYISNTNNFGQVQEQRPMLQPNANGGGGGGGGGGYQLVASHDFAYGETEVIFSGMFTNEFIAYEFIIDNLYVNQMGGYPRLRMQVGTGNPPVFDNVASHYRGYVGPISYVRQMAYPYFAIGGTQNTGPSTRGPLNMSFKSNDLSSNEMENIKVFHGFSGMLGRIMGSFETVHAASGTVGGSPYEFPRIVVDSGNSVKAMTLFWSPHLAYPEPIQGAPPITALRFYIEGSTPGSFATKGSIRIYGYRR